MLPFVKAYQSQNTLKLPENISPALYSVEMGVCHEYITMEYELYLKYFPDETKSDETNLKRV